MQNEPEYELIKSSRKTLAAEIKQGRLIIRAPDQAADEDIRRFIQRTGNGLRPILQNHVPVKQLRKASRN